MYEPEKKTPCYYCTPEEHAACIRSSCEKWIEWKAEHEKRREEKNKKTKKIADLVQYDKDLNHKLKKATHKW